MGPKEKMQHQQAAEWVVVDVIDLGDPEHLQMNEDCTRISTWIPAEPILCERRYSAPVDGINWSAPNPRNGVGH